MWYFLTNTRRTLAKTEIKLKIMVWGQKLMGDFTKGSCRAINTAVVQLVLDFAKESPSKLINWFNENLSFIRNYAQKTRGLLNGVCNVIKYFSLFRAKKHSPGLTSSLTCRTREAGKKHVTHFLSWSKWLDIVEFTGKAAGMINGWNMWIKILIELY